MQNRPRPLNSRLGLLLTSLILLTLPPAAIAQKLPSNTFNYDENKVGTYTLPSLLTLADGSPITSSAQWQKQRRAELLQLCRTEMFGVSPPKPDDLSFAVLSTDPNALAGQATHKRIAISFTQANQTFQFHLTLLIPNNKTDKLPLFLLLNHRDPENTDPARQPQSPFWPAADVIARGYALAAINVSAEVDPDDPRATTGVRAFYRQHHPQADQWTWGTLAAWAWAGSRAIDYLETDDDINPAQIAVIGHSRGGKTALWAAAQDPRIALGCVNNAGEGGPAITRRNYGETLARITTSFPHWFTPQYATYADRIHELPFDQHQLIALLAPRGYHGADAADDQWADPQGSYLALREATPAWKLFGPASTSPIHMPPVNELYHDGPLAYHIRHGKHDLTQFDWKLYLDHADHLFQVKTPAK